MQFSEEEEENALAVANSIGDEQLKQLHKGHDLVADWRSPTKALQVRRACVHKATEKWNAN